jgi:hypothetical protein
MTSFVGFYAAGVAGDEFVALLGLQERVVDGKLQLFWDLRSPSVRDRLTLLTSLIVESSVQPATIWIGKVSRGKCLRQSHWNRMPNYPSGSVRHN